MGLLDPVTDVGATAPPWSASAFRPSAGRRTRGGRALTGMSLASVMHRYGLYRQRLRSTAEGGGYMWADVSLLVLRLAVGSVFAAHGAQKLGKGVAETAGGFESLGIPMPMVAAVVVIAVELGGGIALALGLFTRIAGALLSINMLVAMLLVHLPNGFFLPRGVEFVLVLFGASVALAGVGAGALSVDAVLRGWRRSGAQPAARAVDHEAGRVRRAS